MNNPRYPLLYSFRRCPYAIRSRMALAVAGIKVELREVNLRDKPPEMMAISGKGTVPVLQLADGRIIDESLELMFWALDQSDPEYWLDVDESESRSLIERNDFDFKDKLDRYKYHVRYPEQAQEVYRQQAEEFLLYLEQRLENNNGNGLIIGRTTLADVAIFPFIRQFSRVDEQWFAISPYTKLRCWLKRFEENELFLRVMRKQETFPGAVN